MVDGGSEGTREFHQGRAEVILRPWGGKSGGGGGGGGGGGVVGCWVVMGVGVGGGVWGVGGGGGGRERKRVKKIGESHQILAQVVKGPCGGRMSA